MLPAKADGEVADAPVQFQVDCPACGNLFPLKSGDLSIHSCDSGGVYEVYLTCPRCGRQQDLLE